MGNKNLKRAFGYLKPYTLLAVLSLLLSVVASATTAAPAWLVKYVIDNVLIQKDYKMLIYVSAAIIIIYIIKGIVFYWREYISEYIAGKITYDIREQIYTHLQKMSIKYYSKVETGELLSRFSNDSGRFQSIITTGFSATVKLFSIILLMGTIFYKNWKLALLALIFIPALTIVVRKFSKKLYKTGHEIQEKIGAITSFLQEAISGIRVVKAFATEEYEAKRFKIQNENNFKVNMKNRKVQARVTPVIDFFNAVSVVIILWFGGMEVINGKITSGDFFTFLTALALLYDPLRVLTNMINNINTNQSSADRIFELLDTPADIVDKENAKVIKNVVGNVVIENVTFRYEPGLKDVLKKISIEAKSGEVIALVGKSGSGKTTIANLIPRFYEVESGSIKIDGVDIRDITMHSLRKNVGVVFQETFLFGDTIYANIKYGTEEATDEEIYSAAKMANALEFIEKLPKKMETNVGERGVMLSGGQKQRIAIARAILKNPKVLILDEATSALDTESERLVQDALEKLMKNRTTFVIAHRLSTIINADKIVVMDDGEIKEVGSHEVLLKKNGIYKKLYDIQFNSNKENELDI